LEGLKFYFFLDLGFLGLVVFFLALPFLATFFLGVAFLAGAAAGAASFATFGLAIAVE